MLFRVPEEWAQELHGFSITNAGPTRSFDFLYEKAGGKLFHAVVDGKHPDGQDWFYRWVDGMAPSEIHVPDLPAWLLAGPGGAWAKRRRRSSRRTTAARVVASPAANPGRWICSTRAFSGSC